jgi:23S rRNA pseudouridine2605 synthase
METYRVQKLIAKSGLCSRRKAEKLIEEEQVTVNDIIIKLGEKCFETDIIKVNQKQIYFNLKDLKYIILNKKEGYITTKSDQQNRKTIFDLIDKKDYQEDLFPVGRLDKETSGLIIITNDGNLTQNIIHPSKKIDKKYIAQIDKELCLNHKKTLENGILLDKNQLKPCRINHIKDLIYSITISEGRKRQIRRMFKNQGYNVIKLHREKIGNLNLNELNLKKGEYKIVSKEFIISKIFNKKS